MLTSHAVILDLDDTLYPERDFARSGYRAVATAFASVLGDADATCARLTQLLDTAPRGQVMDAFLAERGHSHDAPLRQQMITCYREHTPTIALYPDARHLLQTLRGRVPLGLITDGAAATQRNKLRALGLEDTFHTVLISAELGAGAGKPSPVAFEQMAESLSLPHERLVYISDNPAKDFIAPNGLGWQTIRVVRAEGIYRDAVPPPGGHPQHTVSDLYEALGLVGLAATDE